jgi:uncharacterized protein YciW
VSVFDATALAAAGVGADSASAAAVRGRANIFEMTEAAENAVLRPADFGAFPHDLRAALAGRIARNSGDAALAARYLAGAGPKAALSEAADADGDLALVLDFVDRVGGKPRDVTAEDVARLRAGGVSDADIVRLCELVAFVAYQIRVVAGLRLLGGTT